MQIRTILYQYIKTLIKYVFLLNFTHALLMSFVIILKREICSHQSLCESQKQRCGNSKIASCSPGVDKLKLINYANLDDSQFWPASLCGTKIPHLNTLI